MDEQKKTAQPEQQPEHPEKKLSRKTLTFYIVGLFSVAIALILISYVAQSRADKQLENLSTKLSEQQTVAQGATQKMEDLQKQLDDMSAEIAAAKQSLGVDAKDSLAESVQKLRSREQLLELLVSAEEAARADDWERLSLLLDGFVDAWSADDLKPAAQGGLFDEQDYLAYQNLVKLNSEKNR
ncbi:MAG: hypothetical protein Q4C72_08960 [Eubacteriales bacterium]|nr:hypothetical protein [Eubacteriales bacterium]